MSISLRTKLISSSQSGLKPGDSCINQLFTITHDIYRSFANGFEVRDVFLDISKTFDKGNLLITLANFLNNKAKSSSKWSTFNMGQC